MSIALDLDFLSSESLDARITASGGANGTRFNSAGQLVTATTPRYDYDPVTHAAKGLLIEEARTNLAYPSEQFDHANWTKSALSTTANTATSPSGATTADKLVPDGTAAKHLTQFGWSATVQAYNGTVFAKADGYSVLGIGFVNNGANGGDAVDLSTGAVVSGAGMTNSPFSTTAGVTVTAIGGGWYRISINRTPNGAGNFYLALYVVPDGTNYHSVGDGTKGILVYGAQIEAGAFATSYIPTTTGGSVTRSVDTLTMTGTDFSSWFNASAGTFVVEATPIEVVTSFRGVVVANDGTSNNFIAVCSNSEPKWTGYVKQSGSDQAQLTKSTVSLGATARVALAYAANDVGCVQDGGAVTTDTSVTVPTVTRLQIGIGTGFSGFNGYVRRIKYDNTRRSDADLPSLTVTRSGSASITEGGDTVTATGQVRIKGTAAITDGDDVATGSAEVGVELVTPAGRISRR